MSRWLEADFFVSVLHEADRERVQDEVTRTHRTGETFRMEYRLIKADGTVVWVLDETVAVRDAEYRPIMLQGCLVDVTDRHDACGSGLRTPQQPESALCRHGVPLAPRRPAALVRANAPVTDLEIRSAIRSRK